MASALPSTPKRESCWALLMAATVERRWVTRMLRAMSSYVFIERRLHPGLLDQFAQGGAQAIEVFAARGHFDYTDRQQVREVGNWFKAGAVEFHSMHSPMYMSNDFSHGVEPPLNIVDQDKRRRIEAMDEIKRA